MNEACPLSGSFLLIYDSALAGGAARSPWMKYMQPRPTRNNLVTFSNAKFKSGKRKYAQIIIISIININTIIIIIRLPTATEQL